MFRRRVVLASSWVVVACASSNPVTKAQAYLQALERNPAAAYAELSSEQRARLSYEQFLARRHSAHRAPPRVQSWRSEDGTWRVRWKEGGWQLEDLALDFDPRQTLRAFVAAVEKADFASAYRLLSKAWRAYYTPEKFAQDFAEEPLAQLRLARLRGALEGPPASGLSLPLTPDSELAVRFVLEEDGYRIESLE